ncbi:MAG: hypothetical protein C4576_13335 [Desulfobacteraceae bacterium]|nr:MAG: hypothetical protein C4576_13335 [Desulfobacteraceae bacterium]
MSLTDAYVQVYGQISNFFSKLQEGQAPTQFTQQHLKDLGFTSANYRAFIPLLKALGFLSADGSPTKRYHEYRDKSQSRRVMGDALRDAYGDLFVLKEKPKKADSALIEGKFKSTHNVSDLQAKRMASTFYSLLDLADLDTKSSPKIEEKVKFADKEQKIEKEKPKREELTPRVITPPGLCYNIQIHLPATKDIEVFNAIFKSLKEHLLE